MRQAVHCWRAVIANQLFWTADTAMRDILGPPGNKLDLSRC